MRYSCWHALVRSEGECGAQAVLYRCRTCRRIVASSANAIPVEKGAGTFRNKRSSHAQRGTSSFLSHD